MQLAASSWLRARRDFVVNAAMALLAVAFGLSSEQHVFYGRFHHTTALRIADVAFGLVCLAGIWLWRRRFPVWFALAASLVGIFSTLAGGVALVGVFSVAVHRRWQSALLISVVAAVAVYPSLAIYPVHNEQRTELAGILMTFAVTGWGMFVRARRQLVDSWQERLHQSEQTADVRAEAARRLERERIAREMHDVLAHRLSLLAVHSGALEFHRTASSDDVARAVAVIRTNAHEALNDLRSVISVLRDHDADSDDDASRPQPTLGDLPALIEESREAGLAVSYSGLDDSDELATDLTGPAARTVYRVVQEALTNVRKHANYSRVRIELSARPDDGVQVSVRNHLASPRRTGEHEPAMAGSGTGLIGLRERVTLAGGLLEYGYCDDNTSFLLHAWLPWRAEDTAAVARPVAHQDRT